MYIKFYYSLSASLFWVPAPWRSRPQAIRSIFEKLQERRKEPECPGEGRGIFFLFFGGGDSGDSGEDLHIVYKK